MVWQRKISFREVWKEFGSQFAFWLCSITNVFILLYMEFACTRHVLRSCQLKLSQAKWSYTQIPVAGCCLVISVPKMGDSWDSGYCLLKDNETRMFDNETSLLNERLTWWSLSQFHVRILFSFQDIAIWKFIKSNQDAGTLRLCFIIWPFVFVSL